MTGTTPGHGCVDCNEPLALFEPTCSVCSTDQIWTYCGPCESCGETADYLTDACGNCGAALPIWRALEAAVYTNDDPLLIWREAVPRPSEERYRRHIGSVHGQWADYRRATDDGGDFHVRRYRRYYELHYDDVSAVDSPTRHLLRHGPAAAISSGIAITRGVTGAVAESGRLAGRTAMGPYNWLPVGNRADAE